MAKEIFNLNNLSKEEIEAAVKAVEKVRKENFDKEQRQLAKEILNEAFERMVILIGEPTAKHLLREKNYELRNKDRIDKS